VNVKELHVKNKYYISINPLPKFHGCTVEFPENVFKNRERINKIYLLDEDCLIEYYLIAQGKKIADKIQAQNSNVRLLVVQDIILTAFALEISKELMVVEDSNKNLFDLLKIPQTKEEADAEVSLCVEFRKLLAGDVPNSSIDGFDQLFYYFEKGGFAP
jgi:hypothetical protein